MSFWNTAMQIFWREESLPVLLMALGIAFLLFHFLKEERKSVLNTLIFFLVCLVLQFISGLLHALQFISAAAILHEAGLIGAGIAVIRLFGLLVFRIILPLMRITPPRIAEDIFVIIAYVAWGLVRLRYAGLDLGSIVASSATGSRWTTFPAAWWISAGVPRWSRRATGKRWCSPTVS